MKKFLFAFIVMIGCSAMMTKSFAQKFAEIKFDKTIHDFGQFSEATPKQSCTFTFKNTGNDVLIINQAVASCGCTVPSYTEKPIQPGEKGSIKVTYDGTGKFTGKFKKTITIRTNAKTEMIRLYIQGDMTPKQAHNEKQ